MNKEASYKINAVIAEIELAINPILAVLEEMEVDAKTIYRVRLALDELITNVVSYAYDGGEGEVEIHYEIVDDPVKAIIISIIDEGVAFDPLESNDPNIKLNADERKIGGLGLFIVKNTMDSMEYRRENNKNILTIKKNL